MDINTPDYFAYKVNKANPEEHAFEDNSTRFGFAFRVFFVTFVIMFIAIVFFILKYSSKMDIEYTTGEAFVQSPENKSALFGYGDTVDEEQRKIDRRLVLIQQQEKSPGEIKSSKKNDDAGNEDSKQIIKNKKAEKAEKQKEKAKQNAKAQTAPKPAVAAPKPILLPPQSTEEVRAKKQSVENIETEKNITIMSKVLIGRYSTFEDAQKVQSEIKARDAKLSPFVKKVGDIFTVQMGSYQDFSVAKRKAQILKSKGFDVWIYQQ